MGATPSTGPRCSEIADFEPIIAHQRYDLAKTVQLGLTLIGSPLSASQRT